MSTTVQSLEKIDVEIELLVRRYTPVLKRFFQRRILEHGDVDDLMQEVFLRLARRGNLSDVSNLEGYLFQTAANILRDCLRQRLSRQVAGHQMIREDYVDDAAFSPERVLLGKEAVDRLAVALEELPERTRAVVILCRIEELHYTIVATRLGISVSAVNKHMRKAMDYLMARMKDDL